MAEQGIFAKARMAKVDEGLGLIFGWGMICTSKGEPYYDVQGDYIPEDVMLEGVTDFMKNARVAKDMHTGEQIGAIVHSFPLTAEIAKAYGIACDQTGWLIAMAPTDKAVLKSFRDKQRTGFSIGGSCRFEVEA